MKRAKLTWLWLISFLVNFDGGNVSSLLLVAEAANQEAWKQEKHAESGNQAEPRCNMYSM